MKLSNCCASPLVDETDVCSKCKEHCEVVYQITATATEGAPVKFRQIWLDHKTDELECNVYTTIGDTKLVIEINGKNYQIDVSELAGKLVEEVIS